MQLPLLSGAQRQVETESGFEGSQGSGALNRASPAGGGGVKRCASGVPGSDYYSDCDDPQNREGSKTDGRKRFQRSRAYFCMYPDGWFRSACIDLACNRIFDSAILCCIIVNAVMISLDDPVTGFGDDTFRLVSEVMDAIFLGIFTFEMLVKLIAMGGFLHHTGYFREAWNWLDFVVVLSGLAGLVLTDTQSFTILRVVRIFRPLRTISRVKGMRDLVDTLGASLPILFNVLLLSLFLFFVFGLIGVILWSRTLHQRCYGFSTELGNYTYTSVCGKESKVEEFHTDCPPDYNCTSGAPNPFEWANWDHIGSSLLIVLQCLTLDDWNTHMYQIQAGWSPFAAIYFISLTLIGAYFVLNLVLAVVTDSFTRFAIEEDDRALEPARNDMQHHLLAQREMNTQSCSPSPMGNPPHPTAGFSDAASDRVHNSLQNTANGVDVTYFSPHNTLTSERVCGEITVSSADDPPGGHRRQQQQPDSPHHADESEPDFAWTWKYGGAGLRGGLHDNPLLRGADGSDDSGTDGEIPDGTLFGADRSRIRSHSLYLSQGEHIGTAQGAQMLLKDERINREWKRFTGGLDKAGRDAIKNIRRIEGAREWTDMVREVSEGCGGQHSPRAQRRRVAGTARRGGGPPATPTRLANLKLKIEAIEASPVLAKLSPEARKMLIEFTDSAYGSAWVPCSVAPSRGPLPPHYANLTLRLPASPTDSSAGVDRGTTSPAVPSSIRSAGAGFGGVLKAPRTPLTSSLKTPTFKSVDDASQNLEDITVSRMGSDPLPILRTRSNLAAGKGGGAAGDGSGSVVAPKKTTLSSDHPEVFPENDAWKFHSENKVWVILRNFGTDIVHSHYFNNTLSALIVLNAVVMSVEHYHMNQGLVDVLDLANIIFVAVFAFETAIKIFVLPVKQFVADRFNVLDALIVVVSVSEILFLNSSAVTIFRVFRLVRVIRVIKLARRWKILKHIVKTVGSSLSYMGYLILLLVLFLYVFAILGRQLFAGKITRCCTLEQHARQIYKCYPDSDETYAYDTCWNTAWKRSHFDDLYWAMIAVFQIVTEDYWSAFMYKAMSDVGWIATFYFIIVVLFGRYLLLNLFVAILLVGLEREHLRRDDASSADDGQLDAIDDMLNDSSDEEPEYPPQQQFDRQQEERRQQKASKSAMRTPGIEAIDSGVPSPHSAAGGPFALSPTSGDGSPRLRRKPSFPLLGAPSAHLSRAGSDRHMQGPPRGAITSPIGPMPPSVASSGNSAPQGDHNPLSPMRRGPGLLLQSSGVGGGAATAAAAPPLGSPLVQVGMVFAGGGDPLGSVTTPPDPGAILDIPLPPGLCRKADAGSTGQDGASLPHHPPAGSFATSGLASSIDCVGGPDRGLLLSSNTHSTQQGQPPHLGALGSGLLGSQQGSFYDPHFQTGSTVHIHSDSAKELDGFASPRTASVMKGKEELKRKKSFSRHRSQSLFRALNNANLDRNSDSDEATQRSRVSDSDDSLPFASPRGRAGSFSSAAHAKRERGYSVAESQKSMSPHEDPSHYAGMGGCSSSNAGGNGGSSGCNNNTSSSVAGNGRDRGGHQMRVGSGGSRGDGHGDGGSTPRFDCASEEISAEIPIKHPQARKRRPSRHYTPHDRKVDGNEIGFRRDRFELTDWEAVVFKADGTEEEVLLGNSWGLIPPENPVRKWLWRVVRGDHFDFEKVIGWLIFLSCVTLVFNEKLLGSTAATSVLEAFDIVFTLIFLLEILMRIAVYTFSSPAAGRSAYIRRAKWNWLDMTIVAVGVCMLPVQLFTTTSGFDVMYRASRAMRAGRPVRILVRSQNMKIVISALVRTIPAVFNVFAVASVSYFMFGVVSVQLFKGSFMVCNDGSNSTYEECSGDTYFVAPVAAPFTEWIPDAVVEDAVANATLLLIRRRWVNLYAFSFNNIGRSLLTLLECAILNGWTEVLYAVVDCTNQEDGLISRDNQQYMGLLVVIWVFFGGLGIMNVFVGCVVDYFSRLKTTLDRSVLLTKGQMQALRIKKILAHQGAKHRLAPPDPHRASRMNKFCYKVVHHPLFVHPIIVSIVLNVLVMTTIHYNQSEEWDRLQDISNIFFSVLFTIEMVLKLGVGGRKTYFATKWNCVDFAVVLTSWVELLIADLITNGNAASIVQLLRLGRIFRLIRHFKGLKKLLLTLYYSIPALVNVGSLLFLVFFIYGVMGTVFFEKVRKVPHNDTFLNQYYNFDTFPVSLLTLYRVATFDNWRTVMQACRIQAPLCSEHDPETGESNCGSTSKVQFLMISFFFSMFVVTVGFVMLNLFIAVVLENFRESVLLPPPLQTKMDLVKMFREHWAYYDPTALQVIKAYNFIPLMLQLPPPLGFAECVTGDILPSLLHLDFPVTRDRDILFPDVIDAIGETVFKIKLVDREAAKSHLVKKARDVKKDRDRYSHGYTIGDWYAANVIQCAYRRWRGPVNHTGLTRPDLLTGDVMHDIYEKSYRKFPRGGNPLPKPASQQGSPAFRRQRGRSVVTNDGAADAGLPKGPSSRKGRGRKGSIIPKVLKRASIANASFFKSQGGLGSQQGSCGSPDEEIRQANVDRYLILFKQHALRTVDRLKLEGAVQYSPLHPDATLPAAAGRRMSLEAGIDAFEGRPPIPLVNLPGASSRLQNHEARKSLQAVKEFGDRQRSVGDLSRMLDETDGSGGTISSVDWSASPETHRRSSAAADPRVPTLTTPSPRAGEASPAQQQASPVLLSDRCILSGINHRSLLGATITSCGTTFSGTSDVSNMQAGNPSSSSSPIKRRIPSADLVAQPAPQVLLVGSSLRGPPNTSAPLGFAGDPIRRCVAEEERAPSLSNTGGSHSPHPSENDLRSYLDEAERGVSGASFVTTIYDATQGGGNATTPGLILSQGQAAPGSAAAAASPGGRRAGQMSRIARGGSNGSNHKAGMRRRRSSLSNQCLDDTYLYDTADALLQSPTHSLAVSKFTDTLDVDAGEDGFLSPMSMTHCTKHHAATLGTVTSTEAVPAIDSISLGSVDHASGTLQPPSPPPAPLGVARGGGGGGGKESPLRKLLELQLGGEKFTATALASLLPALTESITTTSGEEWPDPQTIFGERSPPSTSASASVGMRSVPQSLVSSPRSPLPKRQGAAGAGPAPFEVPPAAVVAVAPPAAAAAPHSPNGKRQPKRWDGGTPPPLILPPPSRVGGGGVGGGGGGIGGGGVGVGVGIGGGGGGVPAAVPRVAGLQQSQQHSQQQQLQQMQLQLQLQRQQPESALLRQAKAGSPRASAPAMPWGRGVGGSASLPRASSFLDGLAVGQQQHQPQPQLLPGSRMPPATPLGLSLLGGASPASSPVAAGRQVVPGFGFPFGSRHQPL